MQHTLEDVTRRFPLRYCDSSEACFTNFGGLFVGFPQCSDVLLRFPLMSIDSSWPLWIPLAFCFFVQIVFHIRRIDLWLQLWH